MFVTAVLPPGNILADLRNVKTTLFRKYGLTSVYAFPPLIPLALSTDEPEEPEWHSVYRQPARITLGNLENNDGHIVIPTHDISVLRDIASQLPIEHSNDINILPLFSLYLGERENIDFGSVESIAVDAETAGVRWKRSMLIGLEFIPSTKSEWWNGSVLTYLWSRSLKSPRRTPE